MSTPPPRLRQGCLKKIEDRLFFSLSPRRPGGEGRVRGPMLRSAAQPTSPSQALTRLGPFLSPLKGGEGLCSRPPVVSRQCRRLSRRRVCNRFPFPGQPCPQRVEEEG